jgi:bifunctional aspartokinase / homoserine dehydrogenase 1
VPGSDQWVVHKFGGTSVADAACFERVASIIEARPERRRAVVLSAARGVTDALLQVVAKAEAQQPTDADLAALTARHAAIAEEILPTGSARDYVAEFAEDLTAVKGVLQTIKLTRSAAPSVRDLVAGYGEIWSSRLFARYLKDRGRIGGAVQWLDARQALIVDWGPLGPGVDWRESKANLDALVSRDFSGALVITGYIASDRRGAQTTLGRNGSDFSASIFGALLDAREIHIWTDVEGVLSADPRRVPDATVIDQLSYNEAMELAYFGAKVIHPQTMAPAVKNGTPIWIRNTFAPDVAGTLICAEPTSSHPVKGITSIDHVAMINLEGAGMIGVPGTAQRLFGALRGAGINVILISQGSSEHSICCAVPESEGERAAAAVRDAFERELREGQIQSVSLDGDLAILAVVGDGMAGTPGVAAKLFSTLGAAAVNVRAIAQGASERNISVVVEGRQATRALRAAHAGFYLSPHTLSIGVIGPGVVGGVLIDQLAAQSARLREQFGVHLRVRGLMGSKRMALSDAGIDPAHWRTALERDGEAADLDRFLAHVRVEHLPHTVIIDCSASEEVARRYRDLFAQGVHVITPNKKANSADFSYYTAMRDARRASGAHYLYEATVGAGLPIIQTARDLRETGDDILGIEGIFSGTLAYLFNVWNGERPFSEVVLEAKKLGYTEPDPRDDLSGLDVARKLVILAREMGLATELNTVPVESLVPEALRAASAEDFLAALPHFDDAMRARFEAARGRGKVLRHVGRVSADGAASVGLVEVDPSHPFANIALTDNVVRFQTRRYNTNPLIVQGPGAGPDVTAGGVFADLLRLAAYLGARM